MEYAEQVYSEEISQKTTAKSQQFVAVSAFTDSVIFYSKSAATGTMPNVFSFCWLS